MSIKFSRSRTANVGDRPDVSALQAELALAKEALEAANAAIKPDVTAGAVDAAVRRVIERSGRPQVFRRIGYQGGIHWLERGNLSIEPSPTNVREVGMTLRMPVQRKRIHNGVQRADPGEGARCRDTQPHTTHTLSRMI